MSMKKAVYIPTGKGKQINKKLNVNGYLVTPSGMMWKYVFPGKVKYLGLHEDKNDAISARKNAELLYPEYFKQD